MLEDQDVLNEERVTEIVEDIFNQKIEQVENAIAQMETMLQDQFTKMFEDKL